MAQPDLAGGVVEAIAAVIGSRRAALHEPRFVGAEMAFLQECIESTFVSSVGPHVDRFEHDLAAVTGARHVIAVSSGTAALHVALAVAGVSPGDEVLVPALSFVATANAVAYCGAVPHFVDAESVRLGIDPAALRDHLSACTERRGEHLVNKYTGRVVRALVPMHTFGHPSDVEQLSVLARDFRLVLLEDAAEALGSLSGGRHAGTFGLMGTLSFNGNKIVTTGGGGAILTDDDALAKLARHLITTAKLPHRWAFSHDRVGFNYRMPNLNAALGRAQIEQLPRFLEQKRRLYEAYLSRFSALEGVRLLGEPEGCRSNFWLQTLILDEAVADQRDCVLAATNDAGFMTRPAWTLLNTLPMYRDCPRADLPVAESLERRLINIPSSAGLA